jgi:hypothetical protein
MSIRPIMKSLMFLSIGIAVIMIVGCEGYQLRVMDDSQQGGVYDREKIMEEMKETLEKLKPPEAGSNSKYYKQMDGGSNFP